MTDDTGVVCFSGGRDSSLAACFEARDGNALCLMTAVTGATIDTQIVPFRIEEIERAFPSTPIEWLRRPCSGLFRRIALADIEADFAEYKTNLILLGHQLAIQTEAILVCLERGYSRIVTGFAGYQSPEYMEQTPEAFTIFSEFAKEYGVTLVAPISTYQSVDAVKFDLLDFGVTTKSLEAVSLFADTFSPASTGAIVAYLHAKLPVARAYLELRLGRAVGQAEV